MSRLQKDSTIPGVASTSQEDQGNRTLKVTLLSSKWKSSTDGDLSTINRELAIQLAKHPNVDVSVLLPNCSGEDRSSAESHNVKLIEADKAPGVEPVLWLSSPPRNHTMDCVIGHGVHIGQRIAVMKRNSNYSHCKWIQVVYSAPEEDGMYRNISEGEKMQDAEIQLAKMADQVITIGPRLAEAYKRYLRPVKQEEKVFDLTPSIFSEVLDVEQATEERRTFCILLNGSGDSCEDFIVKGYDIAAKAIVELKDESYKLKFVSAAEEKGDIVVEKFLHHGIGLNQLTVCRFDYRRKVLADVFCEVDLAIMPSRTEGFGIRTLQALSAGLPVLVSGNSGLGEALKEVLLGSQSVVESEDPKDWAREIKRVRQKKREVRLSESSLLREEYSKKYSWEELSKSLVIKMKNLVSGGSEQVICNLQQWQQNASGCKISSKTDPHVPSDLKKTTSEKGYKIFDNLGSGNCMFHALSEQLESVKGVKIHHFELRHSLVQYLREHSKQVDGTDLFHFVDRHATWDGYLTDMEQHGTWGDHMILWAAANCYQIAIHVISGLPGHSEVIVKPDFPFDQRKHLVLGHVHEVHYVSLQSLQGFSKIEATIPGRGKRQASVNADQPHKRPGKELTLHDHCGGGKEQIIYNLQQWQQNASGCKISSNIDRLSDLRKIALEKGYRISDNPGSGNCMFYALSEQLETVKGVKIHHFELRLSLVQYLRKYPKLVDGTDLFDFVDRRTTWGGYLADLEQDGTWGDHLILWAAANCYQIAIHVISSLPDHSEVMINPDCLFDQSKHLVLGHVHEVHYVSLQPLVGSFGNGVPHLSSGHSQSPASDVARNEDPIHWGSHKQNEELNIIVDKEELKPEGTNMQTTTMAVFPTEGSVSRLDLVENRVFLSILMNYLKTTPAQSIEEYYEFVEYAKKMRLIITGVSIG